MNTLSQPTSPPRYQPLPTVHPWRNFWSTAFFPLRVRCDKQQHPLLSTAQRLLPMNAWRRSKMMVTYRVCQSRRMMIGKLRSWVLSWMFWTRKQTKKLVSFFFLYINGWGYTTHYYPLLLVHRLLASIAKFVFLAPEQSSVAELLSALDIKQVIETKKTEKIIKTTSIAALSREVIQLVQPPSP